MEYLKKSDVMAAMAAIDWNRWAAEKLNKLPTFPAPSDTSDGDLISRKALLDKITRYVEHTHEAPPVWIKDIINSMPAISPTPSVAAPASGNSKLLEMIDIWRQNNHHAGANINLLDVLREIARLLAERGA